LSPGRLRRTVSVLAVVAFLGSGSVLSSAEKPIVLQNVTLPSLSGGEPRVAHSIVILGYDMIKVYNGIPEGA